MSCGCKPKRPVDAEHGELPVARFFLSEEAYQNENSDNVVDAPLSTMGKYMSPSMRSLRSGGNFQKYLYETKGLSWIYVKKVQEASGRTVIDDAWSNVAEESVPCISSSFRKTPKKSCGESHVDAKGKPQATFRWNDAWLFVIDTYKCQENDPALYQLVKTLCTPTSGYHCVGKHGGVDAGYIQYQFEKASHIMIMVSDCGGVSEKSMSLFQSFRSAMSSMLPSTRCKFLVLGFAFLMTGVKMPKPDPMLLCNAMYYGLREHISNGGRNLYVDIICSRFSVAQHMMRELILPASENKISEMAFGKKATSFLCSLRAVPSVYTYYASMYGFTRTADNRSVYPIFFVDTDDIRAGLKDLVFEPPLEAGNHVSNDELIRAIFGESDTETDVIWKAPPGCSLYRIYRLEAPFRRFLKANNMVEQPLKRSKFFPSVQVFHGDNGTNGYYFSKWVSKNK